MYVIKRIYEPATKDDGYRVFVDRLWPRGVSKQTAQIDLWLKAVAPSPALRQWFNHESQKFEEFSAKYVQELDHNPAVATLLKLAGEHGRVTLLYAARDTTHNHAIVLQKYLQTNS
jgi:uncharacterized protein YeaO (DUF488 family)